jgi:hypothetical protein
MTDDKLRQLAKEIGLLALKRGREEDLTRLELLEVLQFIIDTYKQTIVVMSIVNDIDQTVCRTMERNGEVGHS